MPPLLRGTEAERTALSASQGQWWYQTDEGTSGIGYYYYSEDWNPSGSVISVDNVVQIDNSGITIRSDGVNILVAPTFRMFNLTNPAGDKGIIAFPNTGEFIIGYYDSDYTLAGGSVGNIFGLSLREDTATSVVQHQLDTGGGGFHVRWKDKDGSTESLGSFARTASQGLFTVNTDFSDGQTKMEFQNEGNAIWTMIGDGTDGQRLKFYNAGINTTVLTLASRTIQLAGITDAQRDALTAANGMLIYNTTANKFEGREAGSWVDL